MMETQITAAYRQQATGVAVHGGQEPAEYLIARNYRAYRQWGYQPREALQRAKAYAWQGKGHWPKSRSHNAVGAPFGRDNLQWAENPSAIGLRFVGYADELSDWIRHSGWLTNDYGGAMRGVVYQLPGRKGVSRFIAGYQEFESRKPMNGDSAALDLRTVFCSEPGEDCSRYGSDGPKREAARHGDSIAESHAETEREYNEAWQAARQWDELGDEMTETRASARQLVRDMRAAIKSGIEAAPSICSALRDRLRALLDQWEVQRNERDELADSFWYMEGTKRFDIAEFAKIHL